MTENSILILFTRSLALGDRRWAMDNYQLGKKGARYKVESKNQKEKNGG